MFVKRTKINRPPGTPKIKRKTTEPVTSLPEEK